MEAMYLLEAILLILLGITLLIFVYLTIKGIRDLIINEDYLSAVVVVILLAILLIFMLGGTIHIEQSKAYLLNE
jgi:hypothetical protein